jgi:hypothetical protein
MASEVDSQQSSPNANSSLNGGASKLASNGEPNPSPTLKSQRHNGDEANDESPLIPPDTSDANEMEPESSAVVSSVTSPPYWVGAHNRTISNTSVESVLPITLQDNEADDGDGSNFLGRDRNRACWAKSVQVTDYVVVNGSATNIGAFVVWNIRVETLSVSRFAHGDQFLT